MRDTFSGITLFLVALAVAGGLLEAMTRALRVAPALPPRYGEYEPHDVLPFRLKPNHIGAGRPWPSGNEFEFEFRTNAEGFRDVEHSRDKPPGVFRILGLGDSYTAGAGARFEDTYLYRLEQMLNATPELAAHVEIIKAGQPRYWTEPERLLLEVVGVTYRPDMILVGITPNDVTDTYIGWNHQQVRSGYLLTREAYELGPVGLWLYIHSHVARVLLKRYVEFRLRSGTRGDVKTMRWADVFEPDGVHESDWKAVEAELEKMSDIAHSIGAVLVLVHIPTNDFQRPTAPYAAQRLIAFGRRHGVPVIDTLDALRSAATKEPMYWKQDIHCTAAGYRVIAETLYMELIRRNLIERSRSAAAASG